MCKYFISQDRLKELVHYDPDTGLFTAKKTSKRIPAGYVFGARAKYGDGYLSISLEGKQYRAHHLAWLYVHGEHPDLIDHKDGNRRNNAINNLRPATRAQNMWNISKRRHNSSGFAGVSVLPYDRWSASCTINKHRYYLGSFNSPEKASEAYQAFIKAHHGEFRNKGNV